MVACWSNSAIPGCALDDSHTETEQLLGLSPWMVRCHPPPQSTDNMPPYIVSGHRVTNTTKETIIRTNVNPRMLLHLQRWHHLSLSPHTSFNAWKL